MHIGLTPWEFRDVSAAALAEQAVFAEALGYESFFLPENHFGLNAIPDPLMLLAAVASQTKNIRLGTTSYLLPVRHPIQAAEQVAVLDQLSGGRVILGLGRGFAKEMFTAFGVESKTKRQVFNQNLALMKKAWAGEPVSMTEGAEPVVVHPLPVQRPHPELWVAAFGPKALSQVARLNLPYLASPMESLSTLKSNYDAIRTEAGQLVGVPVMRSVFVSRDAKMLQDIRVSLAATQFPLRQEPIALDDWAIIGEPEFLRDKIAEYETDLGMTELIVSRLRLPGLERAPIRDSISLTAETLIH